MSNEFAQTICVRFNNLERKVDQNHIAQLAAISELRCTCCSHFRVLNNNMRAYGGTIQGSLVRQRASNRHVRLLGLDDADEAIPFAEERPATLSRNPKTLMLLWNEFKFGLDGRKPAERFTRSEVNANRSVKQMYWRRKHVWDAIARLVRGGRTAVSAINEIRNVYGHTLSVSNIIDRIIKDKPRYPGGIHPNLR